MNTKIILACLYCEEPIAMGDELARFPIGTMEGPRVAHLECHARVALGGVNHQKGLCTCCPGGTLPPDPPDMTYRESARAALEYAHPGRLGQ